MAAKTSASACATCPRRRRTTWPTFRALRAGRKSPHRKAGHACPPNRRANCAHPCCAPAARTASRTAVSALLVSAAAGAGHVCRLVALADAPLDFRDQLPVVEAAELLGTHRSAEVHTDLTAARPALRARPDLEGSYNGRRQQRHAGPPRQGREARLQRLHVAVRRARTFGVDDHDFAALQ